MKRFSINNKYNATALEIYSDLLNIHDCESDSIKEIKRYKKEFPKEPDYNIALYGNLIIYYYDVRQMFLRCGYSEKHLNRISDQRLWEMYRYRVGEVVRLCF